MLLEGKLFGVLAIHASRTCVDPQENQRLLEVLSGPVAAILRGALATEADRVAAGSDASTGLPNARRLRELLDENGGAGRLPFPVSALGFKVLRVSESTAGNSEGFFAQMLNGVRARVPAASLLFRISERELAVVVLDSDAQSAVSAAAEVIAASELLDFGGSRVTVAASNLLLDRRSLAAYLGACSSFAPAVVPRTASMPSAHSDSIH